MVRIVVLVANKSEDIEVLAPIDIWRRSGFYVKMISVEKKKNIFLAHGNKVSCDDLLSNENLSKYNAIYLPGGPGFEKFNDVDAPRLINYLMKFGNSTKTWFMSICASTMIYGALKMLEKVKATCYPGYEASFKKTYVKDKAVVVDKNFITANGPAAAIEFALTAVAHLGSRAKAEEIARAILYKGKIG